MSRSLKPKAPKFHAEFKRQENRRILIMDREQFENNILALIEKNNDEINLSLSQFQLFPVDAVVDRSEVRAARLKYIANDVYKLAVFRYDTNDPIDEKINTDEYHVWKGLPKYLLRDEMINMASTDYDTNFRDYENNFVFMKMIEKRHVKNHHARNLPDDVKPFDESV